MQLSDFIQASGFTQAQFAERLGCSVGGLAKILDGSRFPRPPLCERILRETGGTVTVEDLFATRAARLRRDQEGSQGEQRPRRRPGPKPKRQAPPEAAPAPPRAARRETPVLQALGGAIRSWFTR